MADERISVSREALRAELAEMELRLIEKLASREQVAALEARLGIVEKSALYRGGPVDAAVQRLTRDLKSNAELDQFVNEIIDERSGQTWSSRDRLVAAVLAVIAVATFLINVFHPFAAKGGP